MLVTLEGYSIKKLSRDSKKIAAHPVTKLIDSMLPTVSQSLSPSGAAALNQAEQVILTADFLSDADRAAYLSKIEQIKKAVAGVTPQNIKAIFASPTGKAEYLYKLEKQLSGWNPVKKVKKAVSKVKAVKRAVKPLTPIGAKVAAAAYSVASNPAIVAATSAVPVVGPAASGGMVAYSAAYKGYQMIKDVESQVKDAKNIINNSTELKNEIIQAAASDAGIPIPPDGLTAQNMENMPGGDKAILAEKIKERQAEAAAKIVGAKVDNRVEEIKAADQARQEEIKNKTFTEPVKPFTQEEIEEFNQGRGSYAERLAAQGKLLGEEMLEFWNVEPYKSELHQAALLIYGSPRYPEMPYPSVEYVEKILNVYLQTVLKLSIDQKKAMYYTGTTATEQKAALGNIYIKIVYMFMKGIAKESDLQAEYKKFDYNLRDMIWIILAQLKTLADAAVYRKFLNPFDFINKSKKEVAENLKADTGGGFMIAAAAVLALILFKKGK